MTWGNPPAFVPDPPKKGKKLTPEQLAGDSEHSQQVALFSWAADNVGMYPALEFLFAVPNGFYGNAEQKGKMKAEGLRSGVPDIILPLPKPDPVHAGLYIELKIDSVRNNKDGGCSANQVKWITWLKSVGYYVKVCYGWEEARDMLIAYLEGKC